MDLGSDISEGTCTMKYSPKMHEEMVRYHKHADLHPLQDEDTLQGMLEIVYECGEYLKSIQRHGRHHPAARRRLARRLHQRLRDARLLRRARASCRSATR